jgi:ribosomal protein S18 acetylase RimI-like enzyme
VPADASRVAQLARDIFSNYDNHYRNDPALPRAAVDEIHPDWAARLCRPAGERCRLLLAGPAGHEHGFAAVQDEGGGVADITLFGVAPARRSAGEGGRLLRQAIALAADLGAQRVTYTTHLTNVAAQRMLSAAGFALARSHHTFHCWFP